jgi:3-oxoacid CoA-transferase
MFDGRSFLMETALTGDVAILRAWKVDEAGNCVFRYTTRAFGTIMAKAARLTIVEAENIVPVGAIHPDEVHLPGIFVDRIVPATEENQIEVLKLREEEEETEANSTENETAAGKKSEAQVRRERIGRRTAKELKEGYYVNLGVGKSLPPPPPGLPPPIITHHQNSCVQQKKYSYIMITHRNPYAGHVVCTSGQKSLGAIRKRHPRHGRVSYQG